MTIKLKGHETFTIREGWLDKGLKAVSDNGKVFSENYGADALGVGSNMSKAIRYWLKAGKFIEESPKNGANLTDIAKIIKDNDEYLEDSFALWIYHINLVFNKDMATTWYLFFNETNMDEFTKEEIEYIILGKMQILAEGKKISERSLRDDISVLLNMYVKERIEDYDPEEKKISPFAKLGLIKKDRDRYFKTQPDREVLINEVFLYALMKYFEEKSKDSVGIDELLNAPLSPGRVLNLKRIALNEYLDNLAALNYITVNRTAGLDMVYLKKNIPLNEIVEKYYEKN